MIRASAMSGAAADGRLPEDAAPPMADALQESPWTEALATALGLVEAYKDHLILIARAASARVALIATMVVMAGLLLATTWIVLVAASVYLLSPILTPVGAGAAGILANLAAGIALLRATRAEIHGLGCYLPPGCRQLRGTDPPAG